MSEARGEREATDFDDIVAAKYAADEETRIFESTEQLELTELWLSQAHDNVDRWGNQSPGLLFLALVEELGEIAEQMIEQSTTRPPSDGEHGTWSQGWRFINDVRRLGLDAREYLESKFDEPAGKDDPHLPTDLPIVAPFEDADAVQDEVDDAAPLLYQLTWSLDDEIGKGERGH